MAKAPSKKKRNRRPSPRRARHVRSRETEVALQLTERDLTILHHLYRLRFLSTNHIVSLLSMDGTNSEQKTKRRLRALYDAGYIDRPPAQGRPFVPGGGSPTLVHSLGKRGAIEIAKKLEAEQGIPRHDTLEKLSWLFKKTTKTRDYVDHTLLIADVVSALEIACASDSRVRFIDTDELIANLPEQTRAQRRPFHWNTHVPGFGEALPCVPDYVFALEYESGHIRHYLLEADRGTMPVESKDLRRPSIYRKMLAYYSWYRQEGHRERFGWKDVRFLFVIDIPEPIARIENILAVCNKAVPQSEDSDLFLMTHADMIRESTNSLESKWVTGRETVKNPFTLLATPDE